MIIAHDIYSETNPAFCSFALVSFTTAYISVNNRGPEVLITYIALPIAMSGDFGSTFLGTNRNTGLLEWLERSPQVRVALAERMNASLEIVTEAIRFGCFLRVLKFEDEARISLGDRKIKKSLLQELSQEPAKVMRRAERLGYWFGSAGSTRAIFDMMGLTV